jgi:predicted DNA-binding transcriptional regulator YafY
VRRAKSSLVVEAHCRLRNAVRCFHADRVVSLADVLSGRVCPDLRAVALAPCGAWAVRPGPPAVPAVYP